MFRKLILLSTVLALLACTASPQPQHYLLQQPRFDALSEQPSTQAKIVIGQIDIAPFLSGSGLVTMTSVNQLHQAYYHRWAESLHSQLQRQLRAGMQQQLPALDWLSLAGSAHLRNLDYRMDVVVDEFHLSLDNQALVSGQWQLRSHQHGYVAHGQFSQQQPLQGDGYSAMIASLEQAWQRAHAEIAQDLARALAAQ